MIPKVLLLDDDYVWIKKLEYHLPQNSYSFDKTTKLDDAIERLKVFRYPVVVTDMRLGDDREGGFKLVDATISISSYSKIIILTGFANQEDKSKADQLGVLYLTKPNEISNYKMLEKRINHSVKNWFLKIEEDLAMGFLSSGEEVESYNRMRQIEGNEARLRKILVEKFSLEELRLLCSELSGRDIFNSLEGEGKAGKCRGIIDHFARRDRIDDLIEYCRQHRPNAFW